MLVWSGPDGGVDDVLFYCYLNFTCLVLRFFCIVFAVDANYGSGAPALETFFCVEGEVEVGNLFCWCVVVEWNYWVEKWEVFWRNRKENNVFLKIYAN